MKTEIEYLIRPEIINSVYGFGSFFRSPDTARDIDIIFVITSDIDPLAGFNHAHLASVSLANSTGMPVDFLVLTQAELRENLLIEEDQLVPLWP